MPVLGLCHPTPDVLTLALQSAVEFCMQLLAEQGKQLTRHGQLVGFVSPAGLSFDHRVLLESTLASATTIADHAC